MEEDAARPPYWAPWEWSDGQANEPGYDSLTDTNKVRLMTFGRCMAAWEELNGCPCMHWQSPASVNQGGGAEMTLEVERWIQGLAETANQPGGAA